MPALVFLVPRWYLRRVAFVLTFIHNDCVWVAERHGEDWVALYRFEAQDGYPTLAELRVLPTPDFEADLSDRVAEAGGLPEGVELDQLQAATSSAWRRLIDGELEPGAAPPGGLTSRGLRTFSLVQAHQEARQLANIGGGKMTWKRREDAPRGSGIAGGDWDDLGYEPEAVREPRRPGRRGREDWYYADFAARYVQADKRGSSRPVADVAEEMSRNGETYTAAYVRDVIHQARRRGFLTDAPAGRAGGTLTDKAHAALAAHRRERPSSPALAAETTTTRRSGPPKALSVDAGNAT